MLITAGGMVNRTHVREVRVVGRNTQGVRVMGLKEGDRVASLAKVAREEDEETSTPPPAGSEPSA
jgi:DNA gyrase subunit A